MLIDAGIRLWGVPRVFATAVALSLAATTDRNIRVDAFRACGRSVEPVTLTRREGLIAHLEALEPDAHPGDALPAFSAAAAEAQRADGCRGGDRRRGGRGSRVPASDRRARSALALAGHRQPRGPIPPGLVRRAAHEGRSRGPAGSGQAAGAAKPPGYAAARRCGVGASRNPQAEAVPAVVVASAGRFPPGLGGAGRRRAVDRPRSQPAALGASRPRGAIARRQRPRRGKSIGQAAAATNQRRSPSSGNFKAAAFGCCEVDVKTGEHRCVPLELGGRSAARRLRARRRGDGRLRRLRRGVRAGRRAPAATAEVSATARSGNVTGDSCAGGTAGTRFRTTG